jgi:hypothetical protein
MKRALFGPARHMGLRGGDLANNHGFLAAADEFSD